VEHRELHELANLQDGHGFGLDGVTFARTIATQVRRRRWWRRATAMSIALTFDAEEDVGTE
jgi:ribosomal protein S3